MFDSKGTPTSLWQRPALLTLDQLHSFVRQVKNVRGGKTLARALKMVAGLTRSPFEAEAALLLSTSRRLGGYGLKIETNKIIPLTAKARKIYQHEYCEADIYIESPDGHRVVDIECQGTAVHSGDVASISDANRTTALESMGIAVILITYQDVKNPERLEVIVQHIAEKLGISYPEKTAAMIEKERSLRDELTSDWLVLGQMQRRKRFGSKGSQRRMRARGSDTAL